MRSHSFPALALAMFLPLSAQEWRVEGGVGTFSLASYPGSDTGRTLVLPVMKATWRDRVTLGPAPEGVGVGVEFVLKRRGPLTWKATVSAEEPRRESHAPALAGMGDRNMALWAGIGLGLEVGPMVLDLGVAQGLRTERNPEARYWEADRDDRFERSSRSAGARASLSLAYHWRLGGTWMGSFTLGASASDRAHLAFLHGISPRQAERRRALLQAGDIRMGPGDDRVTAPQDFFREARLEATLIRPLPFRWTAVFILGGSRILGDSAASPLVKQRNTLGGGVLVTRAF